MINLIFAVDKNWLIGNSQTKNKLPWHYKQDLKYFKKITEGKTVIMGENTYNALSKALPGRVNIVLSFNKRLRLPDALVHDNLDYLMKNFTKESDIFVIGGKTIYEQTYKYADRLYITEIDDEHEGDIYLCKPNFEEFKLISETVKGKLHFKVYERIKFDK